MKPKLQVKDYRYALYFLIGIAAWYLFYATLGVKNLHREIGLFEDMPYDLLFFLTLGDFLYVHFGLKSKSWWDSVLRSAGYTAIAIGLSRIPIFLIHPKMPEYFDWLSDFWTTLSGVDMQILAAGGIMALCSRRLEKYLKNNSPVQTVSAPSAG